MTQPTTRFSNRVDNYVRFRPKYPTALIPYLAKHCQLTPSSVVADIGSGTGKLSELFLDYGCQTIGVEPNGPMRLAAEALFTGRANFVNVDGSAETTTLADNSADFIIAGQAFHWFEPQPTRREFVRILRPGGIVGLIWNERLQTDPFQYAYDQLLQQHALNYGKVNHRNITAERIGRFFAPNVCQLATFDYAQSFDRAGLTGRALSSSYTPAPDHPQHKPFVNALHALFDAHQTSGQVQFNYETKLFYGPLA